MSRTALAFAMLIFAGGSAFAGNSPNTQFATATGAAVAPQPGWHAQTAWHAHHCLEDSALERLEREWLHPRLGISVSPWYLPGIQ